MAIWLSIFINLIGGFKNGVIGLIKFLLIINIILRLIDYTVDFNRKETQRVYARVAKGLF